MPAGRPSTYTPEKADEICRRMAEGNSLVRICQADDMPGTTCVYDWLRKYPEFAANYARAEQERATRIYEESLEIADDPTYDWEERCNEAGVKYAVADHEHVQRSKLRVDTRKWFLSRMDPKRFGERRAHQLLDEKGEPASFAELAKAARKDP